MLKGVSSMKGLVRGFVDANWIELKIVLKYTYIKSSGYFKYAISI